MFEPLLQGLRHDDTAVTEYSLEAMMALDEPRALYPLKRIPDGVPAWSTLPPAFKPEPSEQAAGFQELLPS